MPHMPRREDELARPRERKGGDQIATRKGESRPASMYHADKEWHPIALKMWDALKKSGQSDWYEQSDWALAYSLCDDLSHYKKPLVAKDGTEYYKRSPEMLKAILGGLGTLMVAEGDRRRLRVELHDPEDEGEDASVTAIAEYEQGLKAVK